MTIVDQIQKIRNTVYCMGYVLFFNEATAFPRMFANHCRPQELWYLWAAFTEKNDASDYRFQASLVGSHARCIRLPVPVKHALSNLQYAYKWGVWVPKTYVSRLAQINCSWRGTGGLEQYQPKAEVP